MNELIDEACGRVLQTITRRGWLAETDIIFTTDHGELQGDFGLLYKGPYHSDALDATAVRVAARPLRRRGPGGGHRSGRPGGPRADVLRHRRRGPGAVDAGLGPPARRRRARARARVVRVGQPVPRLRHAPAFRLPRRVVVHGLRAFHRGAAQRSRRGLGRCRAEAVPRRLRAVGHRSRRGGHRHRGALQRRRRSRTSSRTCGTPPPTARCATTWSPTSTPACRPRCGRSR